MTSVFDGMAGVLASVLGAPVGIRQNEGAMQTVQAVFREDPIEVDGGDGRPVLIMSPTLRISRVVAATLTAGGIQRGDVVEPPSAAPRTFRVANRPLTASPAVDAFLVCELQEVD